MAHRYPIVLAGALTLATAAVLPAEGQHAGHTATPPAAGRSVRISEEALHAGGGVPPGWRFTVPPGDPAAGRQVFVQFQCHTCHAVKGEQFPLAPGEAATAGPDLSGMGAHHPAEYFAESIVNPSAVVVDRPGYAGADGRSIMPVRPDMTLGQWVDVVAYVKSLADGSHHGEPGAARERAVGPYRVRIAYLAPPSPGHGHQHGHAHPSGAPGSLVAFVTLQDTGQPMPYLAVTARVDGPKSAGRAIALAPTLGEAGLHYAARTALPEGVRRITLSLGPAALKLAPGAPREVRASHTVSFEWE